MKYLSGLLESVIDFGVAAGDLLILTGNGQYLEEQGISAFDFVYGLYEISEPKGTLVVPGYEDASWVLGGLSFQEGCFVDAMRRIPGCISNNHPTHPFFAVGRLAELLLEDTQYQAPFGRESVVFRMLQAGAKQIMLSEGLLQSPFVYLAEYLSNAAYTDRSVTLNITLPSGKIVKKRVRMPGCGSGFHNLDSENYVTCSNEDNLCVASARDIFTQAKEALKEEPDLLLCEESDCDICAQSRAIIDATYADNLDKQVTALAEEEELVRQDLERMLEGRVTYYERENGKINLN